MGNVIDLKGYRKHSPVIKPGGRPLQYLGTVESEQAFGDRLQRIRASLDKINRLIAELKGMTDARS